MPDPLAGGPHDSPSGLAVRDGAGAGLAGDTDSFLASVRRALAQSNAADALDLLDETASDTSRFAVVVVGEPGTGKSSLINALLGDADLLPVGHRAGTGAYCVLRYGPHARVRVHLPDGQVLTAPQDQWRAWLQRHGRSDAEPRPAWIEVELPDTRLEGLQLVDTPGVGGLDSTLGELTLQSLRLAEAVVFVSSCTAPLGQTELDFLRRASAQVDRVIFVLAKVDSKAGWRKVAAEDQTLLAESALRFAGSSVLPFSAKLAADAARASRPQLAGRLLTDAGVPALWQQLAAVTARRGHIRMANRVRTARSALELAHQDCSLAIALLEDIGDTAEETTARRAQLEEWSIRADDWYLNLDKMSRELKRAVSIFLADRGEALIAAFDAGHQPAAGNDDPAVRNLIADVSELQQEIAQLLQVRVTGIAAEIAGGLTLDPEMRDRLDEAAGADLRVPVRPLSAHGKGSGEGMLQTQSTYMGTMMAHTALTVTAVAILGASNPVGWVLAGGFGAFWAYQGTKTRRTAAEAAARRAWAQRAVSEVIRRIELECGTRIEDAIHLITTTLRRAYPREIARLRSELEACERAAAQSTVERAAALKELGNQRAALRLLIQTADDRLAALAIGQAGHQADPATR
ncbi:MAG TPA: dynamin family protein [Streptosporangiaceae bacterium]|jgi:hypothetical protein|nr:dynamin family protein [Streptosporangiaceae bacterium]